MPAYLRIIQDQHHEFIVLHILVGVQSNVVLGDLRTCGFRTWLLALSVGVTTGYCARNQVPDRDY